mmetsp:Transcript_9198/g.22851  ORF Transcript_9198/g.22851 Transcript_9198/m.22851 type:complete len:141 (-) Transcript_9198:474-896(-)|eukprot:CAMPEP_0116080792 /NCGR_PEP_ID=MMETSP0327-20121206/1864_1 /TAXON_ID=44447 /ORGANISM="Pseudo-nitzschia delicatissima, Strain B596" /LENGTH=140 /DNA_ID=CAMNT_0003571507 /DNA_START=114 /DNA_END=536 /DNA_ORIENTATION=+
MTRDNNDTKSRGSDDELDFEDFLQNLKEERGGTSKSQGTNNDEGNNDMSLDLDGCLGLIPETGKSNDSDESCSRSKLQLGDLPSSSHWGSGFFKSFSKRMSSTRMMTSFRRMSSIKMMEDPDKPRKKRVRFKKFEKIFNY